MRAPSLAKRCRAHIGISRDAGHRQPSLETVVPALAPASAAGAQCYHVQPDRPARTRSLIRATYSYARRHWQGDLPLALAWWVNGLILSGLILLLDIQLGSSGIERLIDTRGEYSLYLLISAVLLLAVPAWQVVGIFRAADRHVERIGTVLAGRATQVAATLFTVLLALRFVVFAGESLPAVRGIYPWAGAHYQVEVLPGGRVIEVRGGITFGVAGQLEAALAAAPDARRLRLNSGGGLLSEAIKVRAIVIQHQLDTDSTELCNSACISVYIAGRHRTLHRNARMGFHLPRNPGFGPRGPVSAAYTRELNYFISRGVPPWFIGRWVASGRRFWYPSFRELRAAGIVQSFVGQRRPASEPVSSNAPAVPATALRAAPAGHRYESASHVVVLEGERFRGLIRLEDLLSAPADATAASIMDSAEQEVAAWHDAANQRSRWSMRAAISPA